MTHHNTYDHVSYYHMIMIFMIITWSLRECSFSLLLHSVYCTLTECTFECNLYTHECTLALVRCVYFNNTVYFNFNKMIFNFKA